MTASLVLSVLALIVLLLIGVLVFYAVRLARVAAQAKDSARRLEAFLSEQRRLAVSGKLSGGLTSRPGLEYLGTRVDEPAAAGEQPDVVTCDRVGLAAVSTEPVYVARARDGVVSVQIGTRPAMPLSYVLDPRTREVLQLVVAEATQRFGYTWSALASEDESGMLVLRRLT